MTHGGLLALAAVAVAIISSAASLRPVWAAPPAASTPRPIHENTVPADMVASTQQAPVPSLKKRVAGKPPAPEDHLVSAQSIRNAGPNEAASSPRLTTSAAQSLPAPIQLSPANWTAWPEYTYPRTIKFEWSPAPGATSYGIEINCFHCCVPNQWCSDAGKPTYIVRELAQPTYTFDYWGSQPGSWRVWVINDKSEDGPTSPWWEFTFSRADNPMRFPPLPSHTAPPAQLAAGARVTATLSAPASNNSEIIPRKLIPRSAAEAPSLSSRALSNAGQESSPIKLIYGPDPSYTDAARKAKITGEVTLSVVVGTDGLVKDISVLRGLTPDLDEVAVNTVKTWRFEPARKDGAAVSSTLPISVNFRLYPESAAKNSGTGAPAAAPAWPARLIYAPDPVFPESARKAKISGEVTLFVKVGANGLVMETSVLQGVTPDMNESAINSVKTWRFAPVSKDGVIVPFTCQIRVDFRLY